MLRISGRVLDVDELLRATSLTTHEAVRKVYRRGEPQLPRTQPRGPRNQYSGINICISDGGFHEFAKQISHAIKSMRKNRKLLTKLVSFKGVDDAVLDFGIAFRETITQCDVLPAELISLAGAIGLGIEVSHYPVSKEKAQSKARKRS